jgi:hypothetical protein
MQNRMIDLARAILTPQSIAEKTKVPPQQIAFPRSSQPLLRASPTMLSPHNNRMRLHYPKIIEIPEV